MIGCLRQSNKTLARLGVLTLLLAAAVALLAQAPKELPKPKDYVSDFAGVMDPSTLEKLDLLAGEVEQKAGAQIAVVTVKSLNGQTIEEYAVDLYKLWGIGGKKDDRGVLILLAPNERKYRVEVGYGLEPILNDAKVGDFGREAVPLLKANNYNAAITLFTNRVAQGIAEDSGVQLAGVPTQRKRSQDDRLSPFIVFLIFLAIIFLLSRRARRPGGWIGPMIFPGGGFGGGGWSGGGGFGGGSGFGGFGGGSSGGGGASGSW
jgi:uncharacterized protein